MAFMTKLNQLQAFLGLEGTKNYQMLACSSARRKLRTSRPVVLNPWVATPTGVT